MFTKSSHDFFAQNAPKCPVYSREENLEYILEVDSMNRDTELKETLESILMVTRRMRKNLYRLMAKQNILPCQMAYRIFPDRRLIEILLNGAEYLRIPCDRYCSRYMTYRETIFLLDCIENRCEHLLSVMQKKS